MSDWGNKQPTSTGAHDCSRPAHSAKSSCSKLLCSPAHSKVQMLCVVAIQHIIWVLNQRCLSVPAQDRVLSHLCPQAVCQSSCGSSIRAQPLRFQQQRLWRGSSLLPQASTVKWPGHQQSGDTLPDVTRHQRQVSAPAFTSRGTPPRVLTTLTVCFHAGARHASCGVHRTVDGSTSCPCLQEQRLPSRLMLSPLWSTCSRGGALRRS